MSAAIKVQTMTERKTEYGVRNKIKKKIWVKTGLEQQEGGENCEEDGRKMTGGTS